MLKENKSEENLIETKGFKPGEKVFSVDQMNIAVMPKKFAKIFIHKNNTKKIGLIILSLGAFILVLMFLAAYWYFFKYQPNKSIEENKNIGILDDEINDSKINKVNNDNFKSKPKNLEPAIEKKEENNLEAEDDIQKLLEKNIAAQKENEKIINTSNLINKATSSDKKIVIKNISTTTPLKTEEEYQVALDSDHDGLTDAEEGILACSLNSPDSDQDGYNDLSEFLNLYNPAGAGALMINSGIEEYRNGKYNYKLFYPKLWKPVETGNGESVIFNIVNNNFMQIVVEDNREGLSLEDWFKKQFNKTVIKINQIVYKRGWLAYKSDDGLNVYLNRPGKNEIYILSYSLSPGSSLKYKNIFQMMVNSFELSK